MARGWRHLWFSLVLLIIFFSPSQLSAQQNQLARIVGRIGLAKGDFPPHPLLVNLEMRGTPTDKVFCDDQGRFGFYNLVANQYRVSIEDDSYEPVSQIIEVNPQTAPMYFVDFRLVPKANAKKDPLPGRVEGSNPYLVDPAEYYRHFPKKTVNEFKSGVEAEHKGKTDDAIEHYEKALTYSPEFYPAHNNLGTINLSRQNFPEAQAQFEAALKSNQNDAQAYFNLANVLLLTQHYDEAKRNIDEGLKRRPDSAFGQFLAGSFYIHTNQAEQAEKSLQQAKQLDPKMPEVYLQLVNLYVKEQRTPDAITELESYLKAFPNSQFSEKARDLLKRLQSETAAAH